MKHSNGFTLVELLVVISIITLLASVVLTSLNSARAKARDAQRKENLHQMETALRIYFLDNNDFPHCGLYDGGGWTARSTELYWSACMTPIMSKYIPVMPIDPINDRPDGGLSLYYYYVCYAIDAFSPCTSAYLNAYFETLTPNFAAITINP